MSDTETGDLFNDQPAQPRCAGCGTTARHIIQRALRDSRYAIACDSCAG